MNSPITSESGVAGHVYIFPASYAQRSLWFLDQMAPGTSLYNMQSGTRISSPVNATVLAQALNEIVRRHESLRTVFQAVEGEPVQVVAPYLSLELPVTDLRQLAQSEREDEALRLAAKEAQTPFDLSKWPLIRTRLVRLGAEDHIFLLTIHHIVCDFWSLSIIQNELTVLYEAYSNGQSSPLADMPIQYADFAEWEWRWLQGPTGAAHLEYWKKQLADLPALRLPTDRPRPRIPTFSGAEHDSPLRNGLYRGLTRLSQKEKVTLFMTMLAAFQVLLHRYSGQDDIVIGTPVANRNRAETENLVGLFVNSVVLRTDLSGNPSFRDLLARVREVTLDAFAHQEMPFEKLVHELNPQRRADHNPLFQVHCQLFSDLGTAEPEGPLDGEPLAAEADTAKFDLSLDVCESPDGLWLHIEYSSELFDRDTIVRMEQHFRTLLEGIVANPDQHISDLPLLGADERKTLLVDWNRTEADYARSKRFHELFEEQAERTPDAVALHFRGAKITYRELNVRANRLGQYLRARDVGSEVLVAICAERSIELIVGLLASLKAGGAYLPLDPNDPRERLRFLMDDARPTVILTQQKFVDRIPLLPSERLSVDAEGYRVATASHGKPVSGVTPQNLAYVIYTSGSTGTPKGVMVQSQAVTNHLLWMQSAFPLTATDRILQKYPFTVDASVCEIFGPLIAGASLVIAEPAERWDVTECIRLLAEHRITVLDVLPSMLQVLLEEEEFRSCGSLRRVICGGEALLPAVRNRFFERIQNAELHNIYGPTETTIGATFWTCTAEQQADKVPIGRPIANTQVYLLDRRLNPVPIGVRGELCIGGDGVARGYLNRPELTAERFISDPFSDKPNARMYRTGDLARYLPDGNIEFIGRIDQQVKMRGHRVEPSEIEHVLSRHTSVKESVVSFVEDEAGHKKLVAWITPTPDDPELWPSVGEYDVYDEVLYYAMTNDEGRNQAYQSAIQRCVKGKVILDIGTGADAILSRFCVEAGAERVYAVELREDAWIRASELVERTELAERITLIHGDSTKVELPEKVDVCVSEILGTIGSSEGVITVLNDARRFLKDGGTMIPRRCVTKLAAVSLPDNLVSSSRLGELPGVYVRRIFEKHGRPFDLRMCIKNFPLGHILSQPQVFEDLDFTGIVEDNSDGEVMCRINRDARLDGFLLWLNLYPGQEELLDSLHQRLSWLPVFLPVFSPGVEVSSGDVIHARCSRRMGTHGILPDYDISGVLFRKQGEPLHYSFQSPICTSDFRKNAFYESLFLGMDGKFLNAQIDGEYRPGQSEAAGRGLIPTLRRNLQEQLPEYMIPSSFMLLNQLPRTPSGKLDHRALPMPGQARVDRVGTCATAGSEAEQIIANVWREVLGLEEVDVHDNFFDLGGDSLLISSVRSRLGTLLDKPISIVDLFRYPTVHSLAKFVGDGRAPTDLLASLQRRALKQIEAIGHFRQQATGAGQ